jgi:hypothetical protein
LRPIMKRSRFIIFLYNSEGLFFRPIMKRLRFIIFLYIYKAKAVYYKPLFLVSNSVPFGLFSVNTSEALIFKM